ncbi:porin [Roseisolibacter sp. H3M3-2]|uniref:porin n=1 Tax=Roseisolibacter sp. H3M3-2 TaxID=3031323 RepID=UPI0023DBB568|nr:porin [Roseisolibacter sp. H3M3-2]MDF1501637.1 porin [Roseisolibacter sp. H3M3-2]
MPTPARLLAAALLLLAAARPAAAQTDSTKADSARAGSAKAAERPWYQQLSLRGYVQARYAAFRTNGDLECAQCDRSIPSGGGIFLRRTRLVVSGDVTDRLSVYLQPDFASQAGSTEGILQLRDVYVDVALDAAKTFRVRVGQSKIPYGWENMQSSGTRVPLDRSDAINSALINERDIAVIGYWAPARVRARLRTLVDSGLKGSGDYGVIGVGVFNGQGTNRGEENDQLHAVARASYPFRLPNGQYVEVGVQGYAGRYVLIPSLRSPGLASATPTDFADRRVAGTFVLYPQPFGLQAEWNVGRGPEADPETRTVRERALDGGYVLATYRVKAGRGTVIPYVQAHRYDGGKKFELDARRYRVRELQAGFEWEVAEAIELTAAYQWSDRTYEDLGDPDNRQHGRLARVQAQFNF